MIHGLGFGGSRRSNGGTGGYSHRPHAPHLESALLWHVKPLRLGDVLQVGELKNLGNVRKILLLVLIGDRLHVGSTG